MKQDGVPKLSEDRISTAFAAQRGTTPVRVEAVLRDGAAWQSSDGGFAILLDDRPAKTPARRALALPTGPPPKRSRPSGTPLGEFIDPLEMPLTRIANVGDRRRGRADGCGAGRGRRLCGVRSPGLPGR